MRPCLQARPGAWGRATAPILGVTGGREGAAPPGSRVGTEEAPGGGQHPQPARPPGLGRRATRRRWGMNKSCRVLGGCGELLAGCGSCPPPIVLWTEWGVGGWGSSAPVGPWGFHLWSWRAWRSSRRRGRGWGRLRRGGGEPCARASHAGDGGGADTFHHRRPPHECLSVFPWPRSRRLKDGFEVDV